MLTLRLQSYESLYIGDPSTDEIVVVRVEKVKGDTICLSTHASRDIAVFRESIALKRLKESGRKPSQVLKEYLAKAAEFEEEDRKK